MPRHFLWGSVSLLFYLNSKNTYSSTSSQRGHAVDDLQEFDEKLKELTQVDVSARPFLCEGSPFACKIFLVGINPATTTSFWDYWSIQNGCDKKKWIRKYLEQHGKFSPTRKRIELFFEHTMPLQVLETNIYPFPSDRENELNKIYRDTSLFDYLISVIQPKLILGHGTSVIKHLSKVYEEKLVKGEFVNVIHKGNPVEVRVENHFSYQWSFDAIRDLASEVKGRYT